MAEAPSDHSGKEDTVDDLVEEAATYLAEGKYPDGCTANRKRQIRRRAEKFVLKDGELFYKQKGQTVKYIVNRSDQLRITKACHVDVTSGHLGYMKTGNRIKERFMWKGIWNDVRKIVATCDECQRMNKKPITTPTVLHPVPVHSPWHHIGMDFIGPIHPISVNGNRFVLTISDYFTKWVEAIPLPSKCALGVAKALFKVFMRMGLPKLLTSDQGGEFRSEIDKHIMKLLGIKRHFITPYHPQANGLDERWNQTLKHMIVKYTNDNKEQWDTYLDTCVFAYNTARQESTLHSPFELMFGRKANLPVDIDYASHTGEQTLDEYKATADCNSETINILTSNHRKMLTDAKNNITISQDKQKEQYDRKNDTRPLKYNIGTVVLLKDFRRKKRKGGGMDYKWLGPYKIVKDLGKGFFALHSTENGKSVKRVHGAHLKLYQNPLSELKQDDSTFTSTLSGEDQSDNIQLHVTLSDSSSDEESLSSTPPPLPPSIMPNSIPDEKLTGTFSSLFGINNIQPSRKRERSDTKLDDCDSFPSSSPIKKIPFMETNSNECLSGNLPYPTLWELSSGVKETTYDTGILDSINDYEENALPVYGNENLPPHPDEYDDVEKVINLTLIIPPPPQFNSSPENIKSSSSLDGHQDLTTSKTSVIPTPTVIKTVTSGSDNKRDKCVMNSLVAKRDKQRRLEKHSKQENNSEIHMDLTSCRDKPSASTDNCDKYWIEELQLKLCDKDVISKGAWLNDNIVSAALALMKNIFPHIEGLQEAILGETLSFNVCKGTFVQVLHVGGNHWITVTTSGCEKPNHVIIYDSLQYSVTFRTKEQIASIMCSEYDEIKVIIPNVQRQSGGKDCGLFALAFAMSVCVGQNPSTLTYVQHKMRFHLLSCLEDRKITGFPTRSRARKLAESPKEDKIYILFVSTT